VQTIGQTRLRAGRDLGDGEAGAVQRFRQRHAAEDTRLALGAGGDDGAVGGGARAAQGEHRAPLEGASRRRPDEGGPHPAGARDHREALREGGPRLQVRGHGGGSLGRALRLFPPGDERVRAAGGGGASRCKVGHSSRPRTGFAGVGVRRTGPGARRRVPQTGDRSRRTGLRFRGRGVPDGLARAARGAGL
ncbi:MAG: hypothetical protein AVDCRST_MAG22-3702, partial [uncultured Rubrobacteraceae bacterium]